MTLACGDAQVSELTKLPKLTVLHLGKNYPINDPDVHALAPLGSILRRLSLHKCQMLTDHAVSKVFDHPKGTG